MFMIHVLLWGKVLIGNCMFASEPQGGDLIMLLLNHVFFWNIYIFPIHSSTTSPNL